MSGLGVVSRGITLQGLLRALLIGALLAAGAAPTSAADGVRQLFFSEPGGSYLSHRLTLSRVLEGGEVRELRLPVQGWSHAVVSPRDPVSGLPTGKRQHKPFTVIKAGDERSAALLDAMLDGTVFDLAVIETYRGGGRSGAPLRVITLEDVFVSAMRSGTTDSELGPVDEFDLSYQKIVWSFANGIEQEDLWGP